MKWFKHDSDAHRDVKIRRLIKNYGIEGYGLYFYCLEEIAREVSVSKFTFELEADSELLADATGVSQKKIEEMMAYMVDIGLFEISNNTITCLKMAHRLDASMSGNPEMRRLIANIRNDDKVMTVSGVSHDSVIADKIRLDKIRKEKTSRFTPPTLQEVSDYCKERENNINPSNFIDHYETNGWMRGKTKIKDWKACVRTWEKSENKQEVYGQGGI